MIAFPFVFLEYCSTLLINNNILLILANNLCFITIDGDWSCAFKLQDMLKTIVNIAINTIQVLNPLSSLQVF